MSNVQLLYTAVQGRPRPEDVADMVFRVVGPDLSPHEPLFRELASVALHSTRHQAQRYANWASSMSAVFHRPAGPVSTMERAAQLLEAAPVAGTSVPIPTGPDAYDPEHIQAFLDTCNALVQRTAGQSMRERLNRAGRVHAGLPKHHRWYNKRVRVLRRLERKLRTLIREEKKYQLTRAAKSGLAFTVPEQDLLDDVNTACFVAYFSARCSRRSVFTNTAQNRAFDHLSELLLERCEGSSTTRWDVIARALADRRVVLRLSEQQKAELLAEWYAVLEQAADLLAELHQTTGIDLDTMIVRRGNDSTTWNSAAGAWNQARRGWTALLYALGMEQLLDAFCPGKVLRLMAADVAAWHRASGSDIHPDTLVWRQLPKPWEVLRGGATCTLEDVRQACRGVQDHRLRATSWTGELSDRASVPFKPTPELVHGVEVSSPNLARALRRARVFSAKPTRGAVPGEARVIRDEFGAATYVTGPENDGG